MKGHAEERVHWENYIWGKRGSRAEEDKEAGVQWKKWHHALWWNVHIVAHLYYWQLLWNKYSVLSSEFLSTAIFVCVSSAMIAWQTSWDFFPPARVAQGSGAVDADQELLSSNRWLMDGCWGRGLQEGRLLCRPAAIQPCGSMWLIFNCIRSFFS